MNNKTAASPPRVLMVIRWPVGGIRTHVRYLLKVLATEYQYTIVAPRIEDYEALVEDLKQSNVEYVPVEPRGRRHVSALLKAVLKLEMTRRFDLVHCEGLTSGVLALPLAKLRGIPIVVTLHDMFFASQFRGVLGGLKRTVVAASLPWFDVVHVVGEDAKSNLLENFPRMAKAAKRVLAIRNGIDVSKFKGQIRRDLRSELGLEAESYLVGFFGRFMSPKGFGYLVEAVRELADRGRPARNFVVLAFGGGGYIREEKRNIERLGLERYFRFLPFTPDIGSAIAGLDLVVMPSVWETCPLLPMEAMVVGTPFVGTNCIGLREVIQDTPSTMVQARSASEIAQAIVEHMEKPKTDAAQAFAAIAEKRFDVESTIDGIRTIYRSLL